MSVLQVSLIAMVAVLLAIQLKEEERSTDF